MQSKSSPSSEEEEEEGVRTYIYTRSNSDRTGELTASVARVSALGFSAGNHAAAWIGDWPWRSAGLVLVVQCNGRSRYRTTYGKA